jgi:DNA polymerase, archaea type
MEFEKNTMLFGADPLPRIVAIELGEPGTLKVYRREKNGSTVADVEPFHPFVWCNSDVVDLGIESEKLEGDLKYGWLITVDSWKELIALRNGLKNAGRDFFAFSDPVQHYLTATGRTLFKDLPFEELKRMQVEVLSFEETVAGVADAGPSDHVMSIALSDNSGWEELLIVDAKNIEESEQAALKRLTAIVKERDPDVIEGHNLFRFDLPYLVSRAKRAKTKLDWGRADGFLHSRPSRLQIAEKTIDYPKFTVGGRHFVDTFLLAQFYDVGMRSLAGFERTDVARHFELCDSEGISALTGRELQRAYTDNSEEFRRRALCGVRETRALSELLSPS